MIKVKKETSYQAHPKGSWFSIDIHGYLSIYDDDDRVIALYNTSQWGSVEIEEDDS